ncbi:MAG: outer membrane beta-barrel protein [Nannocystis sp.]|nr:outer membrane beta-barrel protein [Nannocystis sp.]MBA3549960.1 outer membrane beta-barrel protein [Nannocystis sp.]
MASEAASADADFLPWEVGGFADVNYAFNHNLPDSHVSRGTAGQPRTGEFTLNLVVAYIRRDAVPGRLSPTFELALQAGPAADALVSAEPTPGGEASRFAGSEVWKHLARANIGLKMPRGTEISAGMHLSPIGIGVHWTPYNWNYTPSWQLDAFPYYLAGLKIVHPLGEHHGVQLWLVNGWQTLADANKSPSIMLGYTFTPSPRFALAEYFYSGPETADQRMGAWRMLSDTQFTYNTERFGLAGVFDIGGERRGDLPGRPSNLWMSAALLTRWRVLGKRRTWDMAARPEFFWDRDGRMFGVRQTLISGTVTNDVRIAENLLLRVEYRYSRSTNPAGFFYRGAAITDDAAGLGRDQHTVYFAVAGVFAHRFGKRSR